MEVVRPTRDDKGNVRSGEVLDFQSYKQQKMSRRGRALRRIPSSSYISLIHFAQRAEVTWCGETADLRRHELELLDIRDRNGRPFQLDLSQAAC